MPATVGSRIRRPFWLLSTLVLIALSNVQATAGNSVDGVEVKNAPMIVSERAPTVESRPNVASQRFGLDMGDETVPVQLDTLDLAALAAEDEAASQSPMRVGINRPLGIDSTDGWAAYRVEPGVGTFWSLDIVSPQAQGLRLGFSNVVLPEGSELWIYSPTDPANADGPFDGAGPMRTGEFWSKIIVGEQVCVEYFVPEGLSDDGFFLIDELSHIYRGFNDPVDMDGDGGDRGSCLLDVLCYSSWHPLHNATARFYFVEGGDTWLCSGTLLSTVAGDETPYFMTANHCSPNDTVAATTVAYWFYQTQSCNGSNSSYVQSSYTDVLWTSTSYDISLCMFKGPLPSGVTWAGWDTASLASGEDLACISHPSGFRKKISFGDKISHPWGDNTHYFGVTWTDGTILGGSSGSGMYRVSNQNYVGVASHSAVPTDCDNQDGPSGYGKFRNMYSYISSYLAAGSEDQFAGNHTCLNAQLVGEGTYNDLVIKHIAEDWFMIMLNPCDYLDLTMSHNNDWGDLDIQLYDACSGNLVVEKLLAADNKTVQYTHEGDTAQAYFLRVFLGEGDDDTRNEYSLSFSVTNSGSPLAAPTNVQASDGSYCDDVQVTWNAVTSATEYSIWRSETNSSGSAGQIGTSATTSFTDSTTVDSVTYYYWVKAYNAEPCSESAFSSSNSGYSYCETACFGDLDGDNDIDLSDLAAMLSNYGMTGGATYEDGDLDEDGDVDLSDLASLLSVYGTTCP